MVKFKGRLNEEVIVPEFTVHQVGHGDAGSLLTLTDVKVTVTEIFAGVPVGLAISWTEGTRMRVVSG